MSFCAENDLIPLPSEAQTVARFLVRSSKYSTVNNYLSAINKPHEYYGYATNFRDMLMIKLLLNGTRRRLGDSCEQKLPLTPTQLFLIYSRVDLSARPNHAMWCGLVFLVFLVFFHF